MSKAANKLSFGDGVAAAVIAFAMEVFLNAMTGVLLTCGVLGALFALVLAIMDSAGDVQELIGHIVAKEFLFLLGFGIGALLLFGAL